MTTLEVTKGAAAAARALVARAVLGPAPPAVQLGTITLRPHQSAAVEQLRRSLEEWRGALLADEAGLGKTYVALALASESDRVQIVAPAGLRSMWQEALRATDRHGDVLSFEALSRGAIPEHPFDLLVVDEAHHARNPSTRRYAALAALTLRAPVVLLSGTPVHNARRELETILALFLGTRAMALTDAQRARCIVRRARNDVTGLDRLPTILAPHVIDVGSEEVILEALLALPPPVPAVDGGDGGALLTFALLHQWASSRAALASALRRRLLRAAALRAALEAGRYPTRADLSSWMCGESAVQLELPGLFPGGPPLPSALMSSVAAHESSLAALLARLSRTPSNDLRRADAIIDVARSAPSGRVVCFSQFSETVLSLYRLLRPHAAACALTSRGAVVAGGRISRSEALRRFAPTANAARPAAPGMRIDVLLATDLLSEGVSLQDAAVVVHLDLPWTPARLEQRLGRVARLGSCHKQVSVYAFAPPAPAEALVRAEKRLRDKARVAAREIGAVGAIIPAFTFQAAGPSPSSMPHDAEPGTSASVAEIWQRVRTTAERWDDLSLARRAATPSIATLRTGTNGVVVSITDGDRFRPLASLGGPLTDDPAVLAEAFSAVDDARSEGEANRDAVAHVEQLIACWTLSRKTVEAIGLATSPTGRARRCALQRIARILAQTPRHRHADVARLAAEARQAVIAPCGAGGDRVLLQLVTSSLSDDAWLRTVRGFGAAQRPPLVHRPSSSRVRLVAALILET
ncbi:MAG: hypothetical protein NVS4B3_19400 [Gemmatimonadaceae bacterium]